MALYERNRTFQIAGAFALQPRSFYQHSKRLSIQGAPAIVMDKEDSLCQKMEKTFTFGGMAAGKVDIFAEEKAMENPNIALFTVTQGNL
jgi:hypothetical protein